MNKFLKKKADGPTANDDALHALSQPPSPVMKKSSNSRWKKTAKRQPEPKPQLDLSAALPSTDDFRTSLIMPSLSTRFSMLREQDDPASMLGKASDDSVLQPRRKSRMADFGFGNTGLSDIAEVSSISGSVRPSFAQNYREQSYVSEEGYGSEADAALSSVMSRSRPGEGNVLFGGRQKVYKIPTSGAQPTRSLGKVYYDDDVGMSAFQKYRMKEREVDESQFPRPSDDSQGFDFGLEQAEPGSQDEDALETLPNDSAKDLSHSPSLSSYDKKRSTTSSTARSDARSSTAATSIASQPAATSAQPSPAQAPVSTNIVATTINASIPAAPMSAPFLDRSNTKTRRLYEQGLDQHMHDQQNSAMSRLNSIQRQRALSGKKSPPLLHNVKSAGNLHDRNPQPVYALRPQSPPLTSPNPASFGSVRHANSNCSSPALSGPHSPIDTHFDENRVLTQALEPADRGKATAMGAFNKPAHAFDEQQYLERQKALQRSASTAALKKKPQPQPNIQQRNHRFEFEPEQQPVPDIPSLDQSQSDTPKKHEPTKAYNVFQNAANANYTQVAPDPSPASSKSPLPDTHRTFFGNISASEDEDEEDDLAQSFNQPEYGYGAYQNKWQPTPLQPVSEHPALRSEKSRSTLAEEVDEMEVKPLNTQSSSRSLRNDLTINITPKVPQDVDSPTLGPQAQALNGMVHHLRQRSNQSSLYPGDDFALPEGDVPDVPEVPWNASKSNSHGFIGNTLDTHSARESSYATSNPWDLDEQSFVNEPRASRMTVSPIDEVTGTRFPSNRASEISLVQEGVPSRPPFHRETSEISLVQDHDIPSWQQELRKQHTRDASTATQQERDAFANELAARRQLIQERIQSRSVLERDPYSRGTSPVPTPGAPVGPMRAFAMLRSKTSRESFVNTQEQPPKAQKILGPANGLALERAGYSTDVARPRGNSSPRPPMPTAQHPAFKHDGPGPSRAMEIDPQQAERALASAGRSPASSAGRARSRSNSAATTGRSRSRTGPYRDDLEKAMVEGHGSSAISHTPDMSPFPGASPDVMNNFGRDSEESKKSNYFDQRNAPRLAHNGPSPVTLTSNVYTPGRPAPVANPYSQNPTPPLTGSSPSITQADFTQIMQSNARTSGPGLRKKTISKSDISEPITLLSSTSNVDTVPLPPGASLKNGMDEPPPIPPINPRRRATRKLFSRNRSESTSDGSEVRATASDPALNTSPKRDFHFPPSAVVRMPTTPAVPSLRDYETSPAVQQHGFNPAASPERLPLRSANGPQRAVTAPMEGGMF
ncbi:hypothetical protein M409DRAFT_66312 [Zasmidium cellare ATCC 36951]|uniref:Uncharacterized protein n=1 Tax=Zasmidium cellare ATCC 36951 TaxID=1080233 RepID=A0A6A6CMD3_ZASCE|nr:uncharacterized protein M409DRAFT_66312 [Zasmidium cellare ATCC 36951]KAF2167320.1 hypothetical protein M409DRAFT_66312 [Zasmidium cellare ATCC 36951]